MARAGLFCQWAHTTTEQRAKLKETRRRKHVRQLTVRTQGFSGKRYAEEGVVGEEEGDEEEQACCLRGQWGGGGGGIEEGGIT